MAGAGDNPESQTSQKQPSQSGTNRWKNMAKLWRDLDKFIRVSSESLSVIAMAALITMILVTVIDVVGSKFFNRPFTGFVGLTSYAQVVAISFAMGITFLAGAHIKVELIVSRFPKVFQSSIHTLVNFLGFILFGLIIWQLIVLGRTYQVSGQFISALNIPIYPFIYGIALGFIPVCLALFYQFGNSLYRMVKR